MTEIDQSIENAKEPVRKAIPDSITPSSVRSQSTAHDLKSRLDWGEPGLTIVDVRDLDSFHACRILGAVYMPMSGLPEGAETALAKSRDIYIYGQDDQETAEAARLLRESGFLNVSELKGGIKDWKAIGGTVEGSETMESPSAGAYNVGSRLQEFAAERAKEKTLR